MLTILTATGPDNVGLADPIVHHVTAAGANITELQSYDHDRERLFAMVMRMDWPAGRVPVAELRARMNVIGRDGDSSRLPEDRFIGLSVPLPKPRTTPRPHPQPPNF